VITTYRNPDTDGFACALAYAEHLNKSGQPADVKISGNLHPETLYVLKILHYIFKNIPIKGFTFRNVVLVDASDTKGLDKREERSRNY